jgi:hypothetical protein
MKGALLPMKGAIGGVVTLSFYGYIWRGEIDKEKYLFIYFIFYILYFIFYILYFTYHLSLRNKNFPLLYPLL